MDREMIAYPQGETPSLNNTLQSAHKHSHTHSYTVSHTNTHTYTPFKIDSRGESALLNISDRRKQGLAGNSF